MCIAWHAQSIAWLCGLIPHSALVGVREYDGKVKIAKKSKIVIAISHPDQWGFWEWLGQTPRVGVSPKTSLLLLLLLQMHEDCGGSTLLDVVPKLSSSSSYCYYYCRIAAFSFCSVCSSSFLVLAPMFWIVLTSKLRYERLNAPFSSHLRSLATVCGSLSSLSLALSLTHTHTHTHTHTQRHTHSLNPSVQDR
jgi:hypothetical protein